MGVMGLLAGLVIYYTRTVTRNHSTHGSGPDVTLAAIPPLDLIGLGFLPADSDIVFALQPGPVLAHATRLKQEPRELLAKAGLPPQVLNALAHVGIPLEQIDHLTGAVNADGLRLTLVLILRRSPDEERFLKQLRATRSSDAKERYSVELGGAPFTLARVSPTVWVFGFDAKQDLEAVEKGGHGLGGRDFTPGLTEMVSRVPPDAAVWIATDADRWAEKPLVKMVIAEILKKPEWLPLLARGRALAASLSLNDPPRLRLFVTAADDSTGDGLRAFFLARAAATDGATAGGAGELAFFETPIDPSGAFAALREMLNEAVKP